MPPVRRLEREIPRPLSRQPDPLAAMFGSASRAPAVTLPSEDEFQSAMVAPPQVVPPQAAALAPALQPRSAPGASQQAPLGLTMALQNSAGIDPSVYALLLTTALNRGDLAGAVNHFAAMNVDGIRPSVAASGRLADALVAAKAWPLVTEVLQIARLAGSPVADGTARAAIKAAAEDGNGIAARHIFEAHHGSALTLFASRDIVHILSTKNVDAAVAFVNDLKTHTHVLIDGRTYSFLLHGFARIGRLAEAEQVLAYLEANNMHRTAVPYTMLLSGYSRAGRLQDVAQVFTRMERHGVRPNHITYDRAIRCFAESGILAQAVHYADVAEGARVPLQLTSVHAIVRAAIANQDRNVAKRFFFDYLRRIPGSSSREEKEGLTRLGILRSPKPAGMPR